MTTATQRKLKDGVVALVRYRVRSKMEMPILDVCEGGCLVDSRGWAVKPDERVLVKLPGLGEVGAKVVWIEEGRAGLGFEEALYGPVLDHIFA